MAADCQDPIKQLDEFGLTGRNSFCQAQIHANVLGRICTVPARAGSSMACKCLGPIVGAVVLEGAASAQSHARNPAS